MIASFALVVFSALPPLLVENTTIGSKKIWFGFIIALIVIGVSVLLMSLANGQKMDDFSGPYERKWYKTISIVFIFSFAITIALSIAFANMRETSSAVGSIAHFLPEFVYPIFPWIKRFRAAHVVISPVLLPIKIESIMSVWFMFGCIITISYSTFFSLMPKAERASAHIRNEKYQGSNSGVSSLFVIAFGIYCCLHGYLGWGEFAPSITSRDCIMSVPCFMNNDLAIIAAAGFKFFSIFVFGFGSLIFTRKLLAQRYTL
jgi:hypothetical protein